MGIDKTTLSVSHEQLIKMRAIAQLRCGKRAPKYAVAYFIELFETSVSGEEKLRYELITKQALELLKQKKSEELI